MARARSIVAYALFSLCVLTFTSPALAVHKGPYIVGEQKEIGGIFVCRNEEAARAILEKVSNAEGVIPLMKKLHERMECGFMAGTVLVVGQIGNDVIGENGTPWRIVHVKAEEGENTEEKDFYIPVTGANTIIKRQ